MGFFARLNSRISFVVLSTVWLLTLILVVACGKSDPAASVTLLPPTETPIPPTATLAPPTSTRTQTPVPPTDTPVPPTETATLAPTATATPQPTDTPTPVPTHTGSGGGVIAYCYQPLTGGSLHQIYAINADGSDNRRLIKAPIGLNHHDWSPDGQMIAAVGYVNQSTWSVYVFDIDGSDLTRLTNTAGVWDSEPSWSPDGTRIAFTRIYPDQDNREEVWVMNASGSSPHWIGVEGFAAKWSHDGSRFIYTSHRSGNYEIYTSRIDGTDEQQVTSTSANEAFPAWSPDGSQIAYSASTGEWNTVENAKTYELYVMDADGTHVHQLTDNAAYDGNPRWSPDGALGQGLIVFSSDRAEPEHWEVYVMNADGSDVRQVTHTPGDATAINPVWRPATDASPSSAVPLTQPPAYTPTFKEADCAFEVPAGYQPKCGYLIVPEDRSAPQGRQIRLHVAVFASTGADPAPDPVIHLAGGPGSSALAAALPILRKGGSEILKRRDYILFDQRGTQYSDPYLYCLPYDEYLWDAHELTTSLDEYYDGGLPKLAACIENWQEQGIDLAAYTSAESAADVNDLRLALGYEPVNLYGTSYGTRLALTVMRDHPEGIRSVILDSVYPPQVNLDLELAVNAHRSLLQVLQACAMDNSCSGKYGNIEAEFYEAIDRLEKAPVVVEAFGPYREQPYNIYLDGDLFIDAIFGSLYSMTSIADIPRLIYAAHEESYAELSEPVGGAIGSPLSTGLFWSVICGEEVPFEINVPRPSASASVPLVLREHFSERYALDVCQVWDVPPASAMENEAVISDIPTLLFSGRYDPITPPKWAQETAQALSVHYFYEFPNMAHGVMRSDPCALQMGLAFLDDPLHAPESSCMDEAEGIEFH
jgi:Tol biopolymer transport system component/pimeloyl-ACP methyl ester carboxylesterase